MNMFATEVPFCFISQLPAYAYLGTAMLVYSLLMKTRARLAHDIKDASATHTGLVHEVADKQSQKGCTPTMFSQLSNIHF